MDKRIYFILFGISLLSVILLHYSQNAFFHDSFGYLETSRYLLGIDDYDSGRVNLFPVLLTPFVNNLFILYLFIFLVCLLSYVYLYKIVDFFAPKNELFNLLLIVPSYVTLVLTSILQEPVAFLLITMAIFYLLKRKCLLSILLICLAVFVRPAMLAMIPGFFLGVLYYEHLFDFVDKNTFFRSLYSEIKLKMKAIIKSGLIYCAVFAFVFLLYYLIMSLVFPDPFISFKTLSSSWLIDLKFIVGYPVFWFSLFGVAFAPFVLYSYYRLYKLDKRYFFLFFLLIFVYVFLVWYQANIRYVIFLIIPICVGFSQISFEHWSKLLKVLLALLIIASTLYPFGMFVYYYDFKTDHRVIEVSYNPFIYFDSEYKMKQYDYLCSLMLLDNPSEDQSKLLSKLTYITKFSNFICK